jgi:hypothetical protein
MNEMDFKNSYVMRNLKLFQQNIFNVPHLYPEVVFCFVSFFWWDWGLNSGHLQSRRSTTWALPPVHFVLIILRWDLANYLPKLAWKLDPPYLSFPSSHQYQAILKFCQLGEHFIKQAVISSVQSSLFRKLGSCAPAKIFASLCRK